MGNRSYINPDTMRVSIPPTTETPRVKFPHCQLFVSGWRGAGGGGLLPDNMPDDNPYKTLRHIRSMVITVIKALVHHRVHLRCAEKPLDAPVKSSSQDVHYYYKAVWRVFLGHLSLFPFSWRLPICTQPLYSIHEIYLYLSTRRILPIQEQTFIVSPQKPQGLCID